MKRNINACICAIFALSIVLLSCSDEIKNNSFESVTQADITLTVGQRQPTSRAVGIEGSFPRAIKVLVFKQSGSSAVYQYTARLVGTTNNSITVRLIKSNDSNDKYKLMILGNYSGTALANLTTGMSYSDITSGLIFERTTDWGEDSQVEQTKYPMWGETNFAAVLNTTNNFKDANDGTSEIKLYRALARVDVGLNFTQPDNINVYECSGISSPAKFLLKSVHLYNSNSQGYIIPSGGNPTSGTAYMPPTSRFNPRFDYTPEAENVLFKKMYMNESVAAKEDGDLNASCLVIGGSYNSGATTYYRIEFKNYTTGAMLPVLRNNCYRINIKQVNGPGFNTPDEAFKSKVSSLSVDVIPWNEVSIPISDQVYKLSVDKKVLELHAKANTSAEVIKVDTDLPGSWRCEVKDNPSWLTVTKDASGMAQISVTENSTLYARETELTFKAAISTPLGDRLQVKVKVTQFPLIANDPKLGYANSYIVEPNKTFVFKALNIPDPTLTMEAELIWETSVGLIKGLGVNQAEGTVSFTTGASEGNAVVAIKDSKTGEIKWSWHLWINAQKAAILAGSTVNNRYMDRNLGALSNTANSTSNVVNTFGLHYQWGRKDPFPSSSSSALNVEPTFYNATGGGIKVNVVALSESNGTIQYSIKNPTHFLKANTSVASNKDWLINHNPALWGGTDTNDGKSVKTIYDPCPKGWKVPNKGNEGWGVSSGTILGTWISDLGTSIAAFGGWFPKNGQRNNQGVLGTNNSSPSGYYWTASPQYGPYDGEHCSGALHLYNSSSNHTNWGTPRTVGMAVRCVKDN